jgi:hypothetical protein
VAKFFIEIRPVKNSNSIETKGSQITNSIVIWKPDNSETWAWEEWAPKGVLGFGLGGGSIKFEGKPINELWCMEDTGSSRFGKRVQPVLVLRAKRKGDPIVDSENRLYRYGDGVLFMTRGSRYTLPRGPVSYDIYSVT